MLFGRNIIFFLWKLFRVFLPIFSNLFADDPPLELLLQVHHVWRLGDPSRPADCFAVGTLWAAVEVSFANPPTTAPPPILPTIVNGFANRRLLSTFVSGFAHTGRFTQELCRQPRVQSLRFTSLVFFSATKQLSLIPRVEPSLKF